MYTCGVDHHGEMDQLNGFLGTHFTGDTKRYQIRYCADCNKHFFCVEMDATLGYASNLFVFRVELTDEEAKEILALMEEGASESSRVEQYLDGFDGGSSDRRVVLKDEYYDWTVQLDPRNTRAGEQTSHTAEGVEFHMRLAPAAMFPTEGDNRGTATVKKPFWIAETQVTYGLWYGVRQWALDKGYRFANAGMEGSTTGGGSHPIYNNVGKPSTPKRNEPVTMVSYRDSIVWANALSEMLGYDPVYTYQRNVIRDSTNTTTCDDAVQEETNGFRLPTSNEWELAARYKGSDSSHGAISRGGLWWTPANYASGATADYSHASATQEVAWYGANSGKEAKSVGLKRANGLGVYDMNGNVCEWCFAQSGSGRVLRGGCWMNTAVSLLVGYIVSRYPDVVNRYNGLRLARTYF